MNSRQYFRAEGWTCDFKEANKSKLKEIFTLTGMYDNLKKTTELVIQTTHRVSSLRFDGLDDLTQMFLSSEEQTHCCRSLFLHSPSLKGNVPVRSGDVTSWF